MSCPVCARPTLQAHRPFCSKRCADIDLGRWLTGGYAIPAEAEEPPETGLMDLDRPGSSRRDSRN